MAKKLSTTRKGFAIGLAVVGIAGLSLASAAQLNLTSSSLAAGATVVAACQPSATSITVGFTPKFVGAVYNVDKVTLTGAHKDCEGLKTKATMLSSAGANLGEVEGVIATGIPTSLTVGSAISSQAVASIAVVIY